MQSAHKSELIAKLLESGNLRAINLPDGSQNLIFAKTGDYLCTSSGHSYYIKLKDQTVAYIPRDLVDKDTPDLLAKGDKNCGITLVTREIFEKAHMHTSLSIKFPTGAPEFHVGRKGVDRDGRVTWQQRILNGMKGQKKSPQELQQVVDYWDYTRNTDNEQDRLNGVLYPGYHPFSFAMMMPATAAQAANIYADNLLDTNSLGIPYHSKNQTGSNCIKHPIDKCQQYGINFLPELNTREINHQLITTPLVGDRVTESQEKIFTLELAGLGNIHFYQSRTRSGENMLMADASACFKRFGEKPAEYEGYKYDFHHITALMKACGYEIENGTITKNGKALTSESPETLESSNKWTWHESEFTRDMEHHDITTAAFR